MVPPHITQFMTEATCTEPPRIFHRAGWAADELIASTCREPCEKRNTMDDSTRPPMLFTRVSHTLEEGCPRPPLKTPPPAKPPPGRTNKHNAARISTAPSLVHRTMLRRPRHPTSFHPRAFNRAPGPLGRCLILRRHARLPGAPRRALAARRVASQQLAGANDRQLSSEDPRTKAPRSRAASLPDLSFLRVKKLENAIDLPQAMRILKRGIRDCIGDLEPYRSGLMRLEVHLPAGLSALSWLRSQSHISSKVPSVYFSPRRSSATSTKGGILAGECLEGWEAVAGLGSAWEWKGREFSPFTGEILKGIRRFLISSEPQLRVLGGTRFDIDRPAADEWAPFGSYTFILPALEVAESPTSTVLSYNLAWQPQSSPAPPEMGSGPKSLSEAMDRAVGIINDASCCERTSALAPHVQRSTVQQYPDQEGWQNLMSTALEHLENISTNSYTDSRGETSMLETEYFSEGQQGLDDLLNTLSPSTDNVHFNPQKEDSLTKLVLARKTDLELSGTLSPWDLLSALQDRNPRGYQISLSIPGGGSFVGSTPERLFSRSGKFIASEAVAGTRARGPEGNVEKDFQYGLDLLQSPKDNVEFTIVREWLKVALEQVCTEVNVEVPKSLLRQAAVQHLYSKLSGVVAEGKSDADILAVLNPTPAVCGCSREPAFQFLRKNELFDRGFYAGPFGWISGDGAEFVVAIRSALIREPSQSTILRPPSNAQHHLVSLFGGVGIVQESDADLEWQELNLKINQYDRLLVQQVSPLAQQNINMAWTTALVEELCRMGISTFGIAPGSRSSPLTCAVAAHPRATIVPCIDERSLGFWALGFARSTGYPAPIITTSGTAVANLLPAVVEASMAQIPMLLLTGDRPPELRATGANQAIDQVKIFGDYVRLAHDLPPPNENTPLRLVLTTVDNAVHVARAHPRGPVHLNCQFHEPLAPIPAAYSVMDSEIVERWWSSWTQFTASVDISSPVATEQISEGYKKVLQLTSGLEKCLIVIGSLQSLEEVHAAKKLVSALGWPTVVDVLSGLRLGQADALNLVFYADHVLTDREKVWSALKPDAVLQLGGHITSKRLSTFLESSSTTTTNKPMTWIHVSQNPYRDDPAHLITHKIECSLQDLVPSVEQDGTPNPDFRTSYSRMWRTLDEAVGHSISVALENVTETIVEPLIARIVSDNLPAGNGLFLGNSMPIRDMDMYSSSSNNSEPVMVAANRGASGIDGVLSTAIGFAHGLNRPSTLVVGDVSFLHDVNGLHLLKSGKNIPALTIVLVNNSGGGIFNFLPVANSVPSTTFSTLWTTPHHVDVQAVCRSHGVLHQSVSSPSELESALKMAWKANDHCVVEVITDSESNVDVHHRLQATAADVSKKALGLVHGSQGQSLELERVTWRQYNLPIKGTTSNKSNLQFRHGIIVSVEMKSSNGETYIGHGEVCPLQGVHRESLAKVKREIACFSRIAEGTEVPFSLAMMQGGFTDWLNNCVGIPADDLSPSLRFGVEMAVFCAVSSACGHEDTTSVSSTLGPPKTKASIEICGLVDPKDNLDIAVLQCKQLVAQGFKTIKIKVARGLSPEDDGRMIAAVRSAVGSHVNLRCDANRGWSMPQAMKFADALDGTEIEYIEEPLKQPNQVQDFYEATGLRCALDETVIESVREGFFNLSDLVANGVVSWVAKPSLLGSLDVLTDLAEHSKQPGIDLVISSVFESSLGLSFLGDLACRVDQITNKSPAHGLGTAAWFEADVVDWQASRAGKNLMLQPTVEVEDLRMVLDSKSFDSFCNSNVLGSVSRIDTMDASIQHSGGHSFCISGMRMPQAASSSGGPLGRESPLVVFIHGFMGSRADWEPIMDQLCDDHPCIAVDLPGHGCTTWNDLQPCTIESVASALITTLETMGVEECMVVGYSMGARMALQMAALSINRSLRIAKVVSISGSAGILDPAQREARAVQDARLASKLEMHGLERFLDHWYEGPLWAGLRRRPGLLRKVLQRRGSSVQVHINGSVPKKTEELLGSVLLSLSTGRMAPLHDVLKNCESQLLLIAGESDKKFCKIGKQLHRSLRNDNEGAANGKMPNSRMFQRSRYVEVSDCGHTVHLERPMYLARVLRTFLE